MTAFLYAGGNVLVEKLITQELYVVDLLYPWVLHLQIEMDGILKEIKN